MGRIIDRIRMRQRAVWATQIKDAEREFESQLRAAQSAASGHNPSEAVMEAAEEVRQVQECAKSPEARDTVSAERPSGQDSIAKLTKRVHSLEFMVLRLTPGTREWAEARKEQFERQRRAEERQFLARRAERRAFWGAIARALGFRRG